MPGFTSLCRVDPGNFAPSPSRNRTCASQRIRLFTVQRILINRARLCSPFAILPLYGGCDLMLKNRARPFALPSLQSLITTTSESAPHADIPTFGLVVSATCAFSVGNPRVVPKLCHSRPMHVPATYTPPQERAACRFAFALVPTQGPGIGFLWTLSFRRLIGWFTFVLLRASYLTGISPAFSSTVHYPSLENRAARRFGGCACRSPPRGHPVFQGSLINCAPLSWHTNPSVKTPDTRDPECVPNSTRRTLNAPAFGAKPQTLLEG